MEHVPPYGSADPNASYVDRNSPGAVKGSFIPAAALEHPQREIVAVITAAGLTPSKADLTQLKQAIDALIAAATGGGDTSTYLLMAAARARLPIYPEIISADGTFNLSVPATGTVRIPAGIQVIHRGVFSDTTAEQDFVTAANKTYHLRKDWTTGWALKDVSDVAYNPSALAETDTGFDTGYDDMISHRVVTNASNIATITNLVNKDRYSLSGETAQLIDTPYQDNTLPSAISNGRTITLNLARKPRAAVSAVNDFDTTRTGQTEVNFGIRANSRYSALVWYQNNSTAQTEAASIAYEVWL